MPTCAVCEKEYEGMVCDCCGFDGSMDYEKYPTFAPVMAQAVSARKKARENAQNQYFKCASCGGKQFLLDVATGKPVCAQCGTPIGAEKRCPKCQNVVEANHTFCKICGTRLDGNARQNPPIHNGNGGQNPPNLPTNHGGWGQKPPAPPVNNGGWGQKPPAPPVNNGGWGQQPQNQPFNNAGGAQNPPKVKEPSPGWYQKHIMISKYLGEPAVAFAQSSGTLYVYQDRLEYVKNMGNSAAAAFGLVGIAVAANKMKKTESVVEVYPFRDIQSAHMGKYSGLMATLVLQMRDGQQFTFAGTFTKQTATNLVNIILNGKGADRNHT